MRLSALAIAAAACSSHAPIHTPPPPPPDAAPVAVPDAAPAALDPPAPTFRLGDALTPMHVRARLRIDPDQPGFTGEIWIDAKLAAASKTIWLDARGLTIDHADSGGDALTTETAGTDFLGLHAAPAFTAGALTLHLT